MVYLKLKDSQNNGKILKFDPTSGSQELFNNETNEWQQVNIVFDYLLPYNDKFELYTEISESEAMKYVA